MSVGPTPDEIFRRAVDEGQRRLDQSTLELVSTSFIAGFTIVFGIAALGAVEALVEPQFGDAATVAGALTFGIGVVFLVVGRAELFNENFFDPVATAVDHDESWIVGPLVRLWTLTFLFNFVGGGLFALVVAVDGALPAGSGHVLRTVAAQIAGRTPLTVFASAIIGGALVSLLSYMLEGVDSVGSQMALAYSVGFLLALGPFDHVVVTGLHVFLGVLFGAQISPNQWGVVLGVGTIGNLVGGVGLVTLSHVAQVSGSESD
ncbi:formate/nitrite transporter family protein [Halohasta litorea]|uniref:Formate/nitrite transporter family protein n=1 Tax=Halohasta litorea TaxID=869891 RepID=A0ABD6D5B0_9EURY|nr:formate/nitrite transporter family protein [Halohasta litorea]